MVAKGEERSVGFLAEKLQLRRILKRPDVVLLAELSS
jgi:hypothetical protein